MAPEMWEKTEATGVYRHKEVQGKLKVHATAKDPTTGKIVHRRRTLTGANLEQAKALFRELKIQIRTRTPETTGTIAVKSLTHFAVQWVREKRDSAEWRPSTVQSNRQNLRDHILPRVGHLPPDKLRRAHIRSWIEYAETATYKKNGEERRHAHSTLRRWWRLVKQLVKQLYLEGHCERRLYEWCQARTGPRSEVNNRRESRTLRSDELFQFVAAAREIVPRRSPEITTLAFTGMRAGELFGLNWGDVDRNSASIDISRTFSKGTLGPPKAGRRRIPMVGPVAEALEQQRERLALEENLGLERDIVFPSNRGTRRYTSTLHAPMSTIAQAIGTDIRVGPQVLRRTLNTLLGNAGCRREMIRAILGHDTEEMHTEYTQVRVEDQHLAMDQLFKDDD